MKRTAWQVVLVRAVMSVVAGCGGVLFFGAAGVFPGFFAFRMLDAWSVWHIGDLFILCVTMFGVGGAVVLSAVGWLTRGRRGVAVPISCIAISALVAAAVLFVLMLLGMKHDQGIPVWRLMGWVMGVGAGMLALIPAWAVLWRINRGREGSGGA